MELVLVSAEWFAWIWITINIQMKDVLLSPDLMLWRTATHSPALVHKVSFFMVTDCVCIHVFERRINALLYANLCLVKNTVKTVVLCNIITI